MSRSKIARVGVISVAVAASAVLFVSSVFAQTPYDGGGMMTPGSAGTAAGMGPGAMTGSYSGSPQFTMGFGTMASMMGSVAGQPIENEWHGANGDGLQRTTTGMMVWRKGDNWTAFTNGYQTWVNGPYGLQMRLNAERFPWEAQ